MFIDNIKLRNFRNFSSISLKTQKINIIYGKNASGKTNLLESIFTLLNGHSFKKRNKVLQKYDTDRTVIQGKVDNNNIFIEINNDIKTVQLNFKKSNLIELKGRFPSIIYSMDSFLSFRNKEYLFSLVDKNSFADNKDIMDYLIEYKKIIKIKKRILSSTNRIDESMLKVINNKLVKIMDVISNKRLESIKYINKTINGILNNFTNKTIYIKYKKEDINENITKIEIYKRRILTSLLNKDKMDILLDNKNIFTYSSVGEKKIVLLSIVMTIIKHYNEYITPILLIDDLEGDLDKDSINIAFDILKSLPNQLFLTTLGEYLYNETNIIRL